MDIIELINKEGFRRKLSVQTIKAYCFCVGKFLVFCNKDPRKITKKDVREFMEYLADKGKSGNTLNVYLNAVKFMTEGLLFKNWRLDIRYSKVPKGLPTVLTKHEVLKLINSIENQKHKLMVSLMYSAGLRVSELVNLKAGDLEFDRNYGWVRHGKGNKDRIFILSEKLKEGLKGIVENDLYSDSYIFRGSNGGYISKESVYMIVKSAAKKAGISKNVHPHTLRHSFATHLIEGNYDVCSLQYLLGHNSPETTMVYVHTAVNKIIDVKSPFDSLTQT
jgi:integrase/recombinase XerD